MKYKLRIAPKAQEDIENIGCYIAKDKPNAAIKMVSKIYDVFDLLTENPSIGGSVQKRYGISSDFLFLLEAPYIVFFQIESDYISIYRVLDGRSDYLTKLGLTAKK